MSWWRRLGSRLFVSYAAVAGVGAVVLLITTRVLVPHLFDDRMMGMGSGSGGRGPVGHDAVVAALDRALLVALGASLVAAGVTAAFVTARILRPLDRVRAAARRLAAGHYDERIDPPAALELAALAHDVNQLAASLALTEQRRAELVSDVAHELRTPLTTIRGYVEGIADGVIAPEGDVLATVLAEVDRLQCLAADLSTLSIAEERQLDLDLDDLDLGELVGRIVEALRPQAMAKRLELVAGGTGATVRGDRGRIEQVVTNLVANALTYTPSGGRVVVDVRADDTSAVVTVTDTGIGLPPDEVEHVFERFYRVPGVPRPPGGSGIGLAITRAIVRAHGGDVTAASPGPGQGAAFTVTLPARQGAKDPGADGASSRR